LILGIRTLQELGLIRIDDRVVVAPEVSAGSTVDAVEKLTKKESRRLLEFLEAELPRFEAVTGKTSLIEDRIRLREDAVPIKQRYYPRNPAMQAIIDHDVDKMFQQEVIEPLGH